MKVDSGQDSARFIRQIFNQRRHAMFQIRHRVIIRTMAWLHYQDALRWACIFSVKINNRPICDLK